MKPLTHIGIGIVVLAAAAALLLRVVWGDGPGEGPVQGPGEGPAPAALWVGLAIWVGALWWLLDQCARHLEGRFGRWLAPALLGMALVYLWEILVVGFDVPKVLLPAPHAVGEALVGRFDVLAADFRQTALSVMAGYLMGCGAGIGVAVLADRFDFLKRGLLPLAGLAGAVPIVGIAPIMVMWFGFDWQSKAAVAAIVTFFPMLVNTLAGLSAVDPMHRDLMRTYAAGPGHTLTKLRVPGSLPFVFNALKINSTLALISAIVAEFFGSPIVGLGFRISAEVARMNVDMVWAAIALSALAGSLFYGAVALAERAFTAWHPSIRS
jgi:NitT/TauT family transport system permease protein